MSLFGEKCARCGRKTKHVVDGAATCESCEAEMALLVEAQGESDRPCPVDGEVMKKEIAHMLVIDRCPRCQGVWLDGGELERIKGGVEATALTAMANGFTIPFG
jgi:Transcription factor zinc-finger